MNSADKNSDKTSRLIHPVWAIEQSSFRGCAIFDKADEGHVGSRRRI